MLTAYGVRLLDGRDADVVGAILDSDPVGNVVVASRVRAAAVDRRRLGAELWGYARGGPLQALCYAGPNLIPICASPAAARAFADRAAARGRMCSSIVGREEAVAPLWEDLRGAWSPAREVRTGQPLMVTSTDPAVPGDPAVRRVHMGEVDTLLPAAVAMYTEEVGVSPEVGGGAELYRARVTQLISRGWSFARFDDGRLVFKAEVACATDRAAQIQGVFVAPERRGEGLAAAGMAAVVEMVRAEVAPAVSLYVNSWNDAARRAYERVGFHETAEFSTVMF